LIIPLEIGAGSVYFIHSCISRKKIGTGCGQFQIIILKRYFYHTPSDWSEKLRNGEISNKIYFG